MLLQRYHEGQLGSLLANKYLIRSPKLKTAHRIEESIAGIILGLALRLKNLAHTKYEHKPKASGIHFNNRVFC